MFRKSPSNDAKQDDQIPIIINETTEQDKKAKILANKKDFNAKRIARALNNTNSSTDQPEQREFF